MNYVNRQDTLHRDQNAPDQNAKEAFRSGMEMPMAF